MALDFMRKPDEDIVEYLIRLYDNRATYELSNQEVADLLNKEDDSNHDESRWRKIYQAWQNYFEEYVTKKFNTQEEYNTHILNKYELLKIDVEKQTMRLSDVKREYKKLIRSEARFENLKEELLEAVRTVEPVEVVPMTVTEPPTLKEAMVIISDLHVGMQIDSDQNKYNLEVAQDRLNQLKQRTFNKVKKEGINKLHIVNLGDIIHGVIHVSARVDAEIGVIKQITTASEMLKAFIQTFLDEGIEVDFKSVSGNHSRVIPNKHDSNHMQESFEHLIPIMLDEAFKLYPNYHSTKEKDGLIAFEVSGQPIALVHGHLDSGANAINKLTQMTSTVFRYVFSGHVHHEFVKEHGYTTHFGVGSASGVDSYAISGRFSGRPSQKIVVFGEEDIEENITVYLK